MESEWEYVPLDTISQIIDSRHKTPKYQDVGLPMVRVVDIKGGELELSETKRVSEIVYGDFSKGRCPEIGDLIISRVGSCGNVSYVSNRDKFCIGQNTALIVPKDHGRFVYYCLISPQVKQQIDNMAVGAVQKTISLKSIKALKIPYPNIDERKKITVFLSFIDDKITLNRQINQTLEQMAQALFKSWFVDFDPVIDNALDAGNAIPDALAERAALRQAARDSDDFQPLPDDVRQLFPSEFEDSELGWIPKGWKLTACSTSIEINPKIKLSKGVEAKFVDMKALPTNGYSVDEVGFKAYSGGAKFEVHDVLLARITPCLQNGKTGFVDFLEKDEVGFGSTEFIVLRQTNEIHYGYVACLARDENFRLHVMQSMVGSSGRQRVQNSCFDSYFIAVPTENVMGKFAELSINTFEKMSMNKHESDCLEKLRDTLLPKLISGELRLDSPEVEQAKSLLDDE